MTTMSDDYPALTPARSGSVRRETLGDKIPGLWIFIVLILLMVAMVVMPTLQKRWEAETPPATASDTKASSDTKAPIEQELKARLKTKADTQIRRPADESK